MYSLPAVAVEVLELTGHPKVDTAALKACLENDPALTGKVLKVVNSSLFGLSREVSDLSQALALLGTKPLKLLVLGFSLPERLFADVAGETLGRYWRHTLTKAVAAREICERFFGLSGDEAFIAGLLADLGLLAMLQDLGPPYAAFLQKVSDGGGDLAKLEEETLGFDHAQLTARLLDEWGLPAALVEAVAAPRDADALLQRPPGQSPLPKVLHLAELIAQVVADHRVAALSELLAAGRAYRNIDAEQIKELVATLEEKVAALAEVLSLDLPDGVDYCRVLEQAHARLSEVAADVAPRLPRDEWDELLDATRALRDAAARLAREGEGERGRGGEEVRERSRRCESPRLPLSSSPPLEEAALERQLAELVAGCRRRRCDLSLLLIALEPKRGRDSWQEMSPDPFLAVGEVCDLFDFSERLALRLGEGCCALALPGCDRPSAVELARRLPARGVGVATVSVPPKNFPPRDLYVGAARCLHAAQSGAAGAVKSIEIY